MTTYYFHTEDNIIGTLQSAITSTLQNGIAIAFRSRIDGTSVTPLATTRLFVIDKGTEEFPNERYELIYAVNGHSTTSGVTTLANGVIRGLEFSGTSLAAVTARQKSHPGGAEVGIANSHYLSTIAAEILGGNISTGTNVFKVGDDTAGDQSYYFGTDHTTDPRLYWDDSDKRYKITRGDDEAAAGESELIGGGLRLTTAERDALTWPSGGVTIYNTTLGYTQFREGGAWVSNVSGATVADATTAVAGKVELATSAETQAGTNIGGTGASLLALPSDIAANIQNSKFNFAADAQASDTYAITLTPAPAAYATGQIFTFTANTLNTGASTLNVNALGAKAIKKYAGTTKVDTETGDIAAAQPVMVVYDGTHMVMASPAYQITTANQQTLTAGVTSNADALHTHLFNKKQYVFTTPVTIANTVTETTVSTFSLPANILGTNNMVIGTIYLSDLDIRGAAGATLTLRLKYGATTLVSLLFAPAGTATNGQAKIEVYLAAVGATNSQKGTMSLYRNPTAASGAWDGAIITPGTAAEDSTAAKNLIVTAQWSEANSGDSITAEFGEFHSIA